MPPTPRPSSSDPSMTRPWTAPIQQRLADCSDYYLYAVQQLDTCVAALTVKALQDARKWIETALEDVSECEQGFRKRASEPQDVVSKKRDRNQANNATL
ncbi:hypothetical protein MLD38_016646 [Melastoma candidum]|uniref:Uncharacterized protein n=1 Tax=Melastoma candidum TaxID=119954 RepID=A0ACB9QN20_9MYRT|nr:hypothetical protein MLD38_016646 [Melastoma candidum]